MTVSFLGLEAGTIEGGFQTRRRRCDWLLANRTVQFPALFAVLPSDADLTRSRIFATPASAQASSLSPPGAPPTPQAATISSPRLPATPRARGKMSGSETSAGPAGLLATSSTKRLVASNLKIGPIMTTVWAFRKLEALVWIVL